MRKRDVIIIGAGAAGATAAYHLAKAGKDVTILEKTCWKTIKPCGGGIASSVQKWFDFNLKPAVEQVIKCVEFSWNLEDLVFANIEDSSPFWIVKRENLDELIINEAIKLGAELIKPFSVNKIEKHKQIWQVYSEKGEKMESSSIIIADGSNSPWPKQLGLGPKSNHYAMTTSIRLKGNGTLPKDRSRFEFGLVKNGFAWAFPLKSEVNMGVGTFIGKNNSNNESLLKKLMFDLGFEANNQQTKKSLLRVWNGHQQIHGDGVVVIGDAASLCDPFLAEGLRPAIMSGYEASHSINEWLEGNNSSLQSYSTSMRKNWGESMAWGRRIAQVFYRFPNVGYQIGIKRPTAPRRIAQILSGEFGYEDIAKRVIKRLLFQKS